MLHFWYAKPNLSSLRYWQNKVIGGDNFPNKSIEDYLQEHNIEWIELKSPNTAINTKNFMQCAITFRQEDEPFDFLRISDDKTNLYRYYYLTDLEKTLNRNGAITLNYVLDEWSTFGFKFHSLLTERNPKVLFTRLHKSRVLDDNNPNGRWDPISADYRYFINTTLQPYLNSSEEVELQIKETKKFSQIDLIKETYKYNSGGLNFDDKYEVETSGGQTYIINKGDTLHRLFINQYWLDDLNADGGIYPYTDLTAIRYYFLNDISHGRYQYIATKINGLRTFDPSISPAGIDKDTYKQFMLLTNIPPKSSGEIIYTTNQFPVFTTTEYGKDNILSTFTTFISPFLMGCIFYNEFATYTAQTARSIYWDQISLAKFIMTNHNKQMETYPYKPIGSIVSFNPRILTAKDNMFIHKLSTLLNNFNVNNDYRVIEENEPSLLNSIYFYSEYLSDNKSNTIITLDMLDTRYKFEKLQFNIGILNGIYMSFRIPNYNPYYSIGAINDTNTTFESATLPWQTNALQNYLTNYPTTWDTSLTNARETRNAELLNNVANLASGAEQTLVSSQFNIGGSSPIGLITSAWKNVGQTINNAISTATSFETSERSSQISYQNTLRSINSEKENVRRQPNHIELPTYASGTISLMGYNTTDLKIYTKWINDDVRDLIFSKIKKYGYKLNDVLNYSQYQQRWNFNIIQLDTSFNYNDIFKILRTENILGNYNQFITIFINDYLNDGFIAVDKEVDFYNDETNWERMFPQYA